MIKTFRHKGLERFFETGSLAGIQADHAPKLSRMLVRLDAAESGSDMNVPGWRLHALTGDLRGHFSVWVNGNWRMTFTFEDGDAISVNYLNYH